MSENGHAEEHDDSDLSSRERTVMHSEELAKLVQTAAPTPLILQVFAELTSAVADLLREDAEHRAGS
jgi:hypothetical protein